MLSTLWAHHGSEFIALDDYDVGHPGDGLLNTGFDLERFDGEDELSVETGLFVSPLPRVGVGVDVRFAEDLSYDETTTTYEDVVIRTPKTERQVVVAAPAPAVDPGDGGGPDCNPLLDLDCVPAASGPAPKHSGSHAPVVAGTTTKTVGSGGETETVRVATTSTTRKGVSSHKGIHDHDSRQWFGRLIVETEIGETKLTSNLISTFPDDDQGYWGYGIGAQRSIVERLAAGLEVVGDFSDGGEHEAIASLHYNVGSRATARLGVGCGLTEESPDLTLRTGLIWRF